MTDKKAIKLAAYLGYKVSEDGKTVFNPNGDKIAIRKEKHGLQRQYVFTAQLSRKDTRHNRPTTCTVRVGLLQAYQMWGDEIFRSNVRIDHVDRDNFNDARTNLKMVKRVVTPVAKREPGQRLRQKKITLGA